MGDRFALIHRDAGPVATFVTQAEAERELTAMLRDEPSWKGAAWVEPFAGDDDWRYLPGTS